MNKNIKPMFVRGKGKHVMYADVNIRVCKAGNKNCVPQRYSVVFTLCEDAIRKLGNPEYISILTEDSVRIYIKKEVDRTRIGCFGFKASRRNGEKKARVVITASDPRWWDKREGDYQLEWDSEEAMFYITLKEGK